jgi:hypothetical protein
LKFYKEMNVSWWVMNFKIRNALDINLILLKLWIFTNLNMVFPVDFDFDFDDYRI